MKQAPEITKAESKQGNLFDFSNLQPPKKSGQVICFSKFKDSHNKISEVNKDIVNYAKKISW